MRNKRSISSREDLDALLLDFFKQKGSDLHILTNSPPIFRVSGTLKEQDEWAVLRKDDVENLIGLIADEATKTSVISRADHDLSYYPQKDTYNSHPAKYRVNICNELNGVRIVMRRITSVPPRKEDLRLPQPCTDAVFSIRRGLILVTGPTGSGKSATLAAWVRYLKEEAESEHILTIEDPIEYEQKHVTAKRGSIVTQREKLTDFADFDRAMKSALRQDPDIIQVGELRDAETINLAIEAADTGHLVLATIHSNNVAGTVERILSNYPTSEQEVVRGRIISLLAMVMTQRLEKRKSSSQRIGLHEYLVLSPKMREELRGCSSAEKTHQMLQHFVDTQGMSMIRTARNYYTEGLIDAATFNKVAASLQNPLRVCEIDKSTANIQVPLSQMEIDPTMVADAEFVTEHLIRKEHLQERL